MWLLLISYRLTVNGVYYNVIALWTTTRLAVKCVYVFLFTVYISNYKLIGTVLHTLILRSSKWYPKYHENSKLNKVSLHQVTYFNNFYHHDYFNLI